MTLRAIIFDVDGTIADTESLHLRAFNRAFAAAGLDWHWDDATYDALLSIDGGLARIRAWVEANRPRDMAWADQGGALAALHAAKSDFYLRTLENEGLPLRPGIARLIHEAGFPPGAVNIITGFGEDCGKPLTSHPKVARVAFTGGPDTARHIVRNTAENLAHTTLELGGKSPVVVFDDVDLDSATNAIVAGIFAASGQSCVAGSRLVVQRSIKDALVERLAAKAREIRIGDPGDMETEMGPLATAAQRDHIEDVLERSIEAGAKIVCGGRRPDGVERGYYFEPTIVDCDGATSPSAIEELFGPVLSVLSFDDEAEAVAIANDTDYGLASGVFTRDLARSHRMVKRINAGIVWVNTYRAVSPMAPFGGHGLSGLGREGGAETVLEYTRTKAVWVRTSDDPIPDPFVMR